MQKNKLRVALLQMSVHDSVEQNIEKVENAFQQILNKGIELVVLPEMWSFMVPDRRGKERIEQAKQFEKTILEKMSCWAKNYGILLFGGSSFFLSPDSKKVFNRCCVFDSKGMQIGSYDKVHLFDNLLSDKKTFQESKYVDSGQELSCIKYNDICYGIGICYDLRFPYHFQALRKMNASVIVLPSAFTYKTGQAHWETLLRARAIETQSIVLACNQVGSSVEGVHCYGYSTVIDPWGQIIKALKEDETWLICDIDPESVHETRLKMPVQEHVRKIEDEKYL